MTIPLDGTQIVGDLRKSVQQRFQFDFDFRLNFKGKDLNESRTLRDYNVNIGSTLFVLGRLKGGPVTTFTIQCCFAELEND